MNNKFRIGKPEKVVEKAWGNEVWIHNSENYCGKVLNFHRGASFSMHFHKTKNESWYCEQGPFVLSVIDTDSATKKEYAINEGDCIDIPTCVPHKLTYVGKYVGRIFEVSSQHFDEDSYRVEPGDSQRV